MKKLGLTTLSLLLLPTLAHAQAPYSFQEFIVGFLGFLNGVFIPFLVGIAFVFFLVNVVRFFIIESTNEQGREKAKALAIYGVAAFVLFVIFWGIVNLLSSSLGLNDCTQPGSDYVGRDFVGPMMDCLDS